jgi:hypothetical protein
MSRHWSFLWALVTLAIPSRAWAQEQVPAVPAFPDSLSCLAQQATLGAPRDSLVRDSARAPRPTSAVASQAPAIILRASASAREVRFASQPRIQVRLCGGVLDSVRVLERRNLPDPVQPGITYRNVFIAVEILGHLNAECLASRITGAAQSGACAGIQVRDTTGTVRTPPGTASALRRTPP